MVRYLFHRVQHNYSSVMALVISGFSHDVYLSFPDSDCNSNIMKDCVFILYNRYHTEVKALTNAEITAASPEGTPPAMVHTYLP